MPKPSKKPRTKEELLKDLRGNAKFMERMKFTKEKFFPAIIKATDSVDDAKAFLASISAVLMEKFLAEMKQKTFKDLGMEAALDPKDPHFEHYKELLALFDSHSVYDAKDMIEGMKQEIELFINEEMKTRKVETLQVKWLDEI